MVAEVVWVELTHNTQHQVARARADPKATCKTVISVEATTPVVVIVVAMAVAVVVATVVAVVAAMDTTPVVAMAVAAVVRIAHQAAMVAKTLLKVQLPAVVPDSIRIMAVEVAVVEWDPRCVGAAQWVVKCTDKMEEITSRTLVAEAVVDVVVVVEATKVVKTAAISRTRVELLVDLRTIRQ